MVRSRFLILAAMLIVALIMGCSGSGQSPITPDENKEVAESGGNTFVAGLWEVVIDKNTGNVDITQLRHAEEMINVLGFLEPPPLTGMTINFDTLVIDFDNNLVEADVILTHPIDDPVFMGFDVRGMVFGPEVTNADGCSPAMSPVNFSDAPFGFFPGLLGNPNTSSFTDEVNDYKYFADVVGLNDNHLDALLADNFASRGVFANGSSNSRHYDLDFGPDPGDFLNFQYAVYANYNFPTGDPPIDLDDFDITTSNSNEAFAFSVTEVANSLYFSGGGGGGAISLDVEVFDWQGDVTICSIESQGVIPIEIVSLSLVGSTPFSRVFQFVDVAGTPTTSGDLDILVTAVDSFTFGDAWFLDLLPATHAMYDELVYTCYTYTTTVSECNPPTVTGFAPSPLLTFPGFYNDCTVTGTNFSFAGGVTAVHIHANDGTLLAEATDIQNIDDTTVTCDFDLAGWTGGSGFFDVMVITQCEGTGDDIVEVEDNLLFGADFGDGDGGCTGTYVYNSADGRWEEGTANTNYPNLTCRNFFTPEFDVPGTASDVHVRVRHSAQIETSWDGFVFGWTPDSGTSFYGGVYGPGTGCSTSPHYWKYESDQNYNTSYYWYAWYYAYFYTSCQNYCYYYWGWTNRAFEGTFGSLGTGVWSQFHLTGGENLLGMSNAKFQCKFMSDFSVTYRGHEIYEMYIWYT